MTNCNANATNSIAKPTNSTAKATNSIAKPTNSIANGTNSIAIPTNSIANGTNSIAKATNSIAKTCIIIRVQSQSFLGALHGGRNQPIMLLIFPTMLCCSAQKFCHNYMLKFFCSSHVLLLSIMDNDKLWLMNNCKS